MARGYKNKALDPTLNVMDTLRSAVSRQDDLRLAEQKRQDDLREEGNAHRDAIIALRAEYDAKLAEKESDRIDSIRLVDVNAVSIANERAIAQATVLANQVATTAETLRALVSTSATQIQQQITQIQQQITSRLDITEKAQNDKIAAIEKAQSERRGSGETGRWIWGWVASVAALMIAAASVFYANFMNH